MPAARARRTSPGRAVAASALAVLLCSLPTSCRQIAGIEDRALGVNVCGGFDAAINACSECIAGACCDQEAACAGDPACAAGFACFLGCAPSDGTCQSACDTRERFTDARAKLQVCMTGACPDACPRACAANTLTKQGCPGCAETCCGSSLACGRDLGCSLERSCEEACSGDRACIDGCVSARPEGAAIRARTASCAAERCGPAKGGPWACVGSTRWYNTDPTPMTLKGVFHDATSGQQLPGLDVRACSPSDPPCKQPLATAVTDSDGVATLAIDAIAKPRFFAGYLEISGTALGAHYFVILYIFPPPTVSGDIGRDLVSIESLKVLTEAVGVGVDDSRGHAFFRLKDCRFDQAAEVSLAASTADAKARRYYVVKGSPSTTATSSPTGFGGFVDLPPGLTAFTASYTPLCLQYASLALFVRAGWITEADLLPSP